MSDTPRLERELAEQIERRICAEDVARQASDKLAAAQARIAELECATAKVTHCAHCGDTWYDSGIASASCPHCLATELDCGLTVARQRIAELESERDEALQLAGGPTTLREVANECVRARMREGQLERERDTLLEVTNAVLHMSDMSDEQLVTLKANCRAAVDKAREA